MSDDRSVKAHLARLRAQYPGIQAEYERLGPRWAVINQLIQARNTEGLTQRELGALMGVSQAVVSRLFSAEHSPRIDTIAAAAGAMGYDIEVRLVKREAAQRRVAEDGGEYERAPH